MLTAVQADVDIIEMPFDAYVSKPVSGDEFLNLVDELVRLKDYDERSREFFRIASKKRSLELNPKVDTGEDSALHVLVTRMEALQKDLNGTLEGLIEEDTAQISEPD